MKMKNIISQLLRGGLLCVAITAFVTSCSTDEITYATGQKPDKETLETVAGTLRSSKSLRDRVPIHFTEGNEDAVSDKIYYRLNQAASQALTLTATPNPSLVADYNADNKANLQPLPVANIKLANGGKITIPAGTRVSEKLDLTIESDGLTPGIYLMPVVVNISENEQHVLYYGVTVREFDENIYQEGNNLHNIELDTEWTTVFYLNTSEVQAHYADYVAWEKQDMNTFESVYRASLGNIVNLRIAQIADFVTQVKVFITTYELDGVNLWDRGSGYGKEGMPAVNTTSYPKLIKALHEAMPDKMLTVVDYEEPTESFYDTSLTGGIAVGELIDYAWHGYVSEKDPIRFVNPYNQFTSYEQVYSRKPFAGLSEAKYGNVNVPFYSAKSDLFVDFDMDKWSMNAIMWNIERTSNIIVFDDLVLPQVNFAELGCISMIQNFIAYLAYDENFDAAYGYNVMMRIPGIYRQGSKNYDTFAKDW